MIKNVYIIFKDVFMDTLVITGNSVLISYDEFEKKVLYHTSFSRYDQIAVYDSNKVIFAHAQIMAD